MSENGRQTGFTLTFNKLIVSKYAMWGSYRVNSLICVTQKFNYLSVSIKDNRKRSKTSFIRDILTAHCSLVQLRPLPAYPLSQAHVNDPGTLVHVASMSHSSIFSEHSSMSVKRASRFYEFNKWPKNHPTQSGFAKNPSSQSRSSWSVTCGEFEHTSL